MSAAKFALDQAIYIALQAASTTPAATPADGPAKLQEISRNLSTAIDAYVMIKLNTLVAQLKNPMAYVGSSAAGPVVITPTEILAYDPNTI